MQLFCFHNRASPSKKVETIMIGRLIYVLQYKKLGENWMFKLVTWNTKEKTKICHRMETALSN